MVKQVVGPNFYAEALARLSPKPSAAALFNQASLGPNWGLASLADPQSASADSQGQSPVVTSAIAPKVDTTSVGGSAGDFESFVNSIAKQESGGNYSAVNKSSGALGKYQIMPANIPSWSKSALGRSVTTQQFLKDPKLQEAVARKKLQYYYNKYGAANAAKAWYGGEGSIKRSAGAQSRGQAGGYPSLNSYAAAVTRRLKK